MKRNRWILLFLILSLIMNGWFIYQNYATKEKALKGALTVSALGMSRDLSSLNNYGLPRESHIWDNTSFRKQFAHDVKRTQKSIWLLTTMLHDMEGIVPSSIEKKARKIALLFSEKYSPTAARIAKSNESILGKEQAVINELLERINQAGFPPESDVPYNWETFEERLDRFLNTEPSTQK
jgi:hypothetical protein